MLFILLIIVSIGISIWLSSDDYNFFGHAIPLCFGSIMLWLCITVIICSFLPQFSFETEIDIDGYHLDHSLLHDNLSYIHDGNCYRVSGDVTIFHGGTQDKLIITDNYIDVPDWFWLISFMDFSSKPWSTDYFIR